MITLPSQGKSTEETASATSIGADVMTDYDEDLIAQRIPQAGEQYTCLFNSSGANQYGPGSKLYSCQIILYYQW